MAFCKDVVDLVEFALSGCLFQCYFVAMSSAMTIEQRTYPFCRPALSGLTYNGRRLVECDIVDSRLDGAARMVDRLPLIIGPHVISRTMVFRSLELSFPGTFAPGSKIPRTFAPTPSNFRWRHSFMDMYAYAVSSEFFYFCCTKAFYILGNVHIIIPAHNTR